MKREDLCLWIDEPELLDNHYPEHLAYESYDSISCAADHEIVVATFPELVALSQDLKDHGEAGGGAWCSTIAANKVGFQEHPGRAIVIPVMDDYEDELHHLPALVPQITTMANEDSNYAWPAVVWKSEKGRDDIVVPGAPFLKIEQQMRKTLGKGKRQCFAKPQPHYLPVVMVAGETFAFGGFWLDFQWQEKMAIAAEISSELNKDRGIKRKSSLVPSCYATERAGVLRPVVGKMRLFKYIEAPFQVQLQLPTVCQSGRLLQ